LARLTWFDLRAKPEFVPLRRDQQAFAAQFPVLVPDQTIAMPPLTWIVCPVT
jgi:hypothetical protein